MPARPPAHLSLGARGEATAARFLERAGLTVLERNWRWKQWELDMVCREGDTLVFVEVKTRGPGSLAAPAEAVDGRKQAKLGKADAQYLSKNKLWDSPCRFDVVCVRVGDGGEEIEHVRDAFSPALGGGHAAWQPW